VKRYIVLGLAADIEAWRRERGLSPRAVIVVSTREGHRAIRGYGSGEYEVITLESWARASLRVNLAVRQDLDILRQVATVS
jgi:hypothetical protein